jgi:TRAP-type C4-dicarboxylate transport system permease small subunit
MLHILSAFWTVALAVLVFADVVGRGMFSSPVPGTKEILQNSVVTIAFLQFPLAVYSGSMLRTPILLEALPYRGRQILRAVGGLLGFAVLASLVWATWPSFLQGYAIGEYEGEGSLRVITWPVRGAIAVMGAFAAYAYLVMIYLDFKGVLLEEAEAPGAMTRQPADQAQ